MTEQSSGSNGSLRPQAADAAEFADKAASDRQRLATLLGRLLARHWLRHDDDHHKRTPNGDSTGGATR